mmetsp:Transcript_2551/g.8553  ORF Transcript_2551/g.8553 Transcript_2551/m.8553 type:complete len:275 (+) Transcript_2551:1094-1918(+)
MPREGPRGTRLGAGFSAFSFLRKARRRCTSGVLKACHIRQPWTARPRTRPPRASRSRWPHGAAKPQTVDPAARVKMPMIASTGTPATPLKRMLVRGPKRTVPQELAGSNATGDNSRNVLGPMARAVCAAPSNAPEPVPWKVTLTGTERQKSTWWSDAVCTIVAPFCMETSNTGTANAIIKGVTRPMQSSAKTNRPVRKRNTASSSQASLLASRDLPGGHCSHRASSPLASRTFRKPSWQMHPAAEGTLMAPRVLDPSGQARHSCTVAETSKATE